MLDKIVFFSGIHGSGKSTLIKDLSKIDNIFPYENIDANYHLEHTYHRAILRMAKYWVDTQRMVELSKKNSDKIILASRCVYDNLAYVNGFYDIGWISKQDYEHHRSAYKSLFGERSLPINIVYLNPPEEWVIENIKKRWETHPKKWREDEFEYLSAVHESFYELYSELKNPYVLRLEETNREKRVEVVLEWMKDMDLTQSFLTI
ncbi:MAG TPA: deoxynucleoside kinase [Candidatus Nanoarchaeia archaeon]|nr:deoxynucleoside kinase [Candidatus Nanoarchaeia archaeon]